MVYHCGAHSRSHRTAQLCLLLIWWSKRTSVFQSVRSSAIEKLYCGRFGKTPVRFGLSTCRSRLKKKCALFRTIGPPITPPQSRWVVVGFSRLFCLTRKSLAVNRLLTQDPNTTPLNWFVPAFVTALMIAPLARPNSASYML